MKYLIAFVMMLAGTAAYAQTNLNGTSGCPAVPPYNGAVCWNDTLGLWQHGVGGIWVNQTGSGGSPSAGGAGILQQSNGAGGFQAYAGSSCSNQALSSLNASGVGTCSTITSAFVDTTIAKTGTDINTSNQITVTHLAAALPASQGGTGLVSPTQFSLLYANGASAFGTLLLTSDQLVTGVTGAAPVALSITNCGDSTHALAYSTSTHLFSCQAIAGTGGTGSATSGQFLWDNGGAVAGLSGTGIPKANGASAPTLAVAGTDYAAGYVTVAASDALLMMGGLI